MFQTTGQYCSDFFDVDNPDPADPFMFSGTAAQRTSAVAVTLNNRCDSNAACCTRVWCHSSNANSCFDVRYSLAFIPPGSTPKPLTAGELAGVIIGSLLLLCCMAACTAFVKHMCGIREDTPQTTTYLTTTNPSAAAAGVQAWGSSGPQAQGDMHKLSSVAQQQPSHPQGMHSVVALPAFTPQPAAPAFVPQAYPQASSAPLPRQGPQQPANNSFIPQPAPFFPDNN